MQRIPEPELMDHPEQARAYAEADFAAPHTAFVAAFREAFPRWRRGRVLDLGCGPADIAVRFAQAFPACRVDGVDGAEAMLALGRAAVQAAGLVDRVALHHVYLPHQALPAARYDAVLSNSLLHHLADPLTLWRAIRSGARLGAPVLVMDLMRPVDRDLAQRLVQEHAAAEPALLQRDFLHSLCAAYRPEEVRAQLAAVGLDALTVRVVSDRHFLVYGYCPGEA